MIARREGIACLLVDALSFVKLSLRGVDARGRTAAGIISVDALRMGQFVCQRYAGIALDAEVTKGKLIGVRIIRTNFAIQKRRE